MRKLVISFLVALAIVFSIPTWAPIIIKLSEAIFVSNKVALIAGIISLILAIILMLAWKKNKNPEEEEEK